MRADIFNKTFYYFKNVLHHEIKESIGGISDVLKCHANKENLMHICSASLISSFSLNEFHL